MEPCTDRAPLFLTQDSHKISTPRMEPFTAGAPRILKSELSQNLNSGDQALDWSGRRLYLMRTPTVLLPKIQIEPFLYVLLLSIRSTYGAGVGGGLFRSCWPNNQWTIGRTPSHNPNSDTTGSPRWSLAWTDGEPLILTSNVMRNPCSVNCHASHACGAALALCWWPLCRESGFAMHLRLPGP